MMTWVRKFSQSSSTYSISSFSDEVECDGEEMISSPERAFGVFRKVERNGLREYQGITRLFSDIFSVR
ncbi:MAG: hypothetical protein IIB44_09800 [Candidatus Marinimicrobia bacterium]|nr:hypothetical protein [Candidatus Neomarinimicrobiota bacterium]